MGPLFWEEVGGLEAPVAQHRPLVVDRPILRHHLERQLNHRHLCRPAMTEPVVSRHLVRRKLSRFPSASSLQILECSFSAGLETGVTDNFAPVSQ